MAKRCQQTWQTMMPPLSCGLIPGFTHEDLQKVHRQEIGKFPARMFDKRRMGGVLYYSCIEHGSSWDVFSPIGRRWRRHQPSVTHRLDQLHEFRKTQRLDHVIIGGKPAGPFDVLRVGRGGQHQHWQGFNPGLLSDPFQHFEARFFGQVDVQKDKTRKGVPFTVGKRTCAGEVFQGTLAVANDFKRMADASLFEGEFEEENIILIIFDIKDARLHRQIALQLILVVFLSVIG